MQPTAKPGFIPELEATRGIAALIVAAFHISQSTITTGGGDRTLIVAMHESASVVEAVLAHLFDPFLQGMPAVWYFFALSGFVLTASLARDTGPIFGSAWRFAVRRLCRIYPAVWFAILAFVALYFTTGFALQPTYGFAAILRNMLLLRYSIDGVAWSMQAELLATPLIFVAVVLWRRGRIAALYVLTTVLVVMSFWSKWKGLIGPISITEPLYIFLFGVLTFATGRKIVERIDLRFHGYWMAGAVLVFFGLTAVPGLDHYAMLIKSAAGSVLIGFLAFGRNRVASQILNASAVRFLGRVSYSFYLLHPLTLAIIWHHPAFFARIVDSGVPRPVLLLLLWAGSTLAVLPLAYVSHRFVELPGIALGRRLCRPGSASGAQQPEPGARRPGLAAETGPLH